MSYHETIKDATGYDELLAGSEIAILTKNVTLKQGKVYRRGMLQKPIPSGRSTFRGGSTARSCLPPQVTPSMRTRRIFAQRASSSRR